MRKIYFFTIISIVLISMNLSLAGFQEDRGFITGKCYNEVGMIKCFKDNKCELLIFPLMPGQVAFQVESVSKEIETSPPSFYQVKFQVKHRIKAKIQDLQPIEINQVNDLLKKTSYMGTPVKCIQARTDLKH